MSDMKEDVVFTTEEAMKYLRISKPTLLKHIRERKIRGTKVGRSWRILQSELYRFLRGEET